MATIDASKLARALRQRFPGAVGKKRVAAILGIDSDLLNAMPEGAASSNGNGNDDRLKKLRMAIEQALEQSSLGNRIHDDTRNDIIAILDRHLPNQNVHRDIDRDLAGDNQQNFAALEKYLRDKSKLSEDNILEAMRIVGAPANGLPSATGRRAGARHGGTHYNLGVDAKLARRFPGFAEIIIEAPPAMDAKPLTLGPSRAAVARFYAKYPHAARIGRA